MINRNKYLANRTTYNGISYASKAEARRAMALDTLKAAGLVSWWAPQVKFRLGCPENVYVVDFLVAEPCSHISGLFDMYAEDVKGMETAKFKRDKKLWAAYGPIPLRIIKGKNMELINPGDKS